MGCNCGKKANSNTSKARERIRSSKINEKCPHCVDSELKKAVGYLRCRVCGYSKRINR